ncbi:GEVED domain-containing protein [Bizionia sp. KMM 8389]
MKKNLLNLLTMLMLAMSWQGMSQEVEIGYGTNVKSYPLGTAYLYERSSAIYTSSEIGTTGTIYRIAWNARYGDRAASPIKIYLRETSNELQSEVTWANKIAGATLVYDDTLDPIEGWNYFVLSTPFAFSSNNLEVMVEANYGDSSTNPYGLTKYAVGNGISYTLKTNSHQRWTQDFGAPTGTGIVVDRRPNIIIDFGGVTCSPVTNVTTVDRSDTTIDISWESDSFGTSWNILWGASGFVPGDGNEIGADVSTTPSYQITGLVNTTDYQYYIQTDCGAEYTSDWAGPFSFNTRCIAPTNLVANNVDVTDTTALISWTEGDVETAWNISWGPYGYTPGGVDELGTASSTTTSYTITGLTEETYYDFYVQAQCGNGDVGVWSTKYGFTTDCTYLDYLFENFDSYDFTYSYDGLPDCWVRQGSGSTDTVIYGVNDVSPASGTQSLQLYAPTNRIGFRGVLPSFSNVNAGTHWLRFKARVSEPNGRLDFGYVVDENDWSDFTLLERITITNDSWDGTEYIITVPTTLPSNAKLAIQSWADGKNYFIDDLYWEPIPSCTPPSDLITTEIGVNTASFSWSTIPNSLYDLRYREVGTTTWTTIYDIPTNTYTLSGLKQYTEYEVSVRSKCASEEPSLFLYTVSFMTEGFYCYSEVTQPRDYYYISHVGLNTINNNSSDSAYSDFTGISTNLAAGELYSIFITVTADGNYNTSYGVWIDYNGDGIYDSSERVFANNSSSNTIATGSFTVPEDVVLGATSMRVSMKNGSSIPQPCEDYSIGEVEEYSINLQSVASCNSVTGIAISSITSNSAVLTWNASADATEGYRINLYEEGSITPVLTGTVAAGTTGVNLPDLSSETAYEVEVVSICGDVLTSSERISFTTLEDTGYCNAVASNVKPITRVLFAGIDNTSATGGSISYENFSNIVGQVETGGTYNFSAEGNTVGNFTNFFTVWVDWNQDLVFQSDEMYEVGSILNSNGADGQQASTSIVVPNTALEGDARMRVIKNYNVSPTDACGSYTFGQIEDYIISVSYPLSLENNTLLSKLSLYPNPISGNSFYINAENLNGHNVSLVVNDMLGREIYNKNHDVLNNKIQVTLNENLNDGVYLVTVSLKGMTQVFRVIKR